jgi:hypothetical protein
MHDLACILAEWDNFEETIPLLQDMLKRSESILRFAFSCKTSISEHVSTRKGNKSLVT